ncbi:MAG TPA: hypothetical protein VFM84_04185, partial [Holophagaceae bacterium]|nr:hypothetical protein [Holophagaceae bacterium]
RTLAAPQAFAGQMLPAGVQLASQTVLMDLRGAYTWRLGRAEDGGSLGLGAGLNYGSHEESFARPDQAWVRDQSQALLPTLRAEGAWAPIQWLEARVSGQTGALDRSRMREVSAELRFHLPHGYGVEVVWRESRWTFKDDAAAGSLQNRGLTAGMAVAW